MNKPKYIDWIVEETGIAFEDDIPLKTYALSYALNYDILDEWALHLRKHYITDIELAASLKATKLPLEQYLREYVVPQKDDVYGSVSRSNDITEILIADMLEFIYNYTVPRCKQQARSGKTLSEHGTDIIAYKFYNNNKEPNQKDKLIAAEVKAQLTADSADVIISAAKDSKKDEQRFAHTLDYYRKKLKSIGNMEQAIEIERFQQKSENDYRILLLGAAISSQITVTDNIILGITGEQLELKSNHKIFYIHGKKLMDLTHEVYERCVK